VGGQKKSGPLYHYPDEVREVSPLNHKLYLRFMEIADEENDDDMKYPGSCGHMGRWHVGQFITWLEDNYELKEKVDAKSKI
jgi:hypothetical protein